VAVGTGVGVRDGSGVGLVVGLAIVSEVAAAVSVETAVAVAEGAAVAIADGARVVVLVCLGVVAVLDEVGAGEGVQYSPAGGGLSHACTRALDTNSVQIRQNASRSLICSRL
jgi:hypothetical protein